MAEAWYETRYDEMVVVEYGDRPDVDRYFGDLGGCVW
jgi:hypothetical protein